MEKRILLIDLGSYEDINNKGKRTINIFGIPLGLLSIATFLKKNLNGINIKIVSAGIDFISKEDLMSIIKKFHPWIVGIRALSTNEDALISITINIKKVLPDSFIIIGGPHVSTATKDQLMDFPADLIVQGEGEVTSLEVLKNLLAGKPCESIPGTVVKKGKSLIFNPKREFIEDLDFLPIPDYDLVDIQKYFSFENWCHTISKSAYIESSRGCPYGCTYCHDIFGKKARLKSAKRIFDEIKKLHQKYDIIDFFFVDDIFNINYNRAMILFDEIISSGIKIRLHFLNGLRGDLMDKPFIDKMIKAGTTSVAFAIESPSPRIQKYINKNLNLKKLEKNIHYTCEKGIMVSLFFMYGFPTETEEEVNSTIEYMKQFKKCVLPYLFITKYYKNTKMYSEAIKEGFDPQWLETAKQGLYNEVGFSKTPWLSEKFMRKAYYTYFKEIVLNKERMRNAINIQRGYLNDNEIILFYSSFFGREIKDINTLLKLCN